MKFPMTTLALSLMLAAPATSLLASDDIVYKIIGGDTADISDYPSLAPLLYADGADRYSQYQRQYCAGNFITERWVLTAAHCMFDSSYNQVSSDDISLLANVTDLSVGGEELSVANIYVHPDYSPGVVDSANDLALIELEADADVTPMSLFVGDLPAGTSVWLAGWGATEYDERTYEASGYPTELMDVSIPVVSNDDCNAAFESSGIQIADSQVCAGLDEGGKDSCAGDSGGPMMVEVDGELAQAGIVSFGAGCAVAGYPGVYTRVSAFTDWIQSYTSTGGLDGAAASYDSGSSSSSSSGGSGGSGAFAPWLLFLALLRRRFHR
ncbi:serine protease [Granulosicoccaceae sp. 1_MG-2023]|nr:serine protease [Granulosicoccaceae sp. 1_MG-2023]